MNSSKNHIEFLDQIRGIAILAVFLFHCLSTSFGYDELPWGSWFRDFNVPASFLLLLPLSFGWIGVPIFFVTSGFCIHLSFSRNPSWRSFFIRRFFRIYPPYFFAVLLFALVIPWTRLHMGLFGALQLMSHMALIHNFDERFFFGISPAFWSIAVEAQLYLLYPLLLVLVAQLGWHRSLIYIAALEIGLRTISSVVFVTSGSPPPLQFQGLPFLYWYSWSLGAAVAETYLAGRSIALANHSLIAWSIVAFGSRFLKPFESFSFLFFSILTSVAIAKLLQHKHRLFLSPIFLPKVLSMVGVWSYSIYLLHQPLLDLAPRIATKLFSSAHPHPLVIFALCLCLWFPIVGLSALWYRRFEIPSIALSKQLATLGMSFHKKGSS